MTTHSSNTPDAGVCDSALALDLGFAHRRITKLEDYIRRLEARLQARKPAGSQDEVLKGGVNREARFVHFSALDDRGIPEPWRQYGCVTVRGAAVACYRDYIGSGIGPDSVIEVRDSGTDGPCWRLTVEARVHYSVLGLRGDEAEETDTADQLG